MWSTGGAEKLRKRKAVYRSDQKEALLLKSGMMERRTGVGAGSEEDIQGPGVMRAWLVMQCGEDLSAGEREDEEEQCEALKNRLPKPVLFLFLPEYAMVLLNV